MPLSKTISAVVTSLVLTFATGCSRTPPPVTPFPHGEAVQLLDGPAHLGDGRATGQAFPVAASAARLCALVNMPRSADVYLQVRDVRHTETLANVLSVNGRATPLPITLERSVGDLTSNGMSASPVERVRLEQGPSEICLVAGQKQNGDIDDFEVAGLTMFVEGVDTRDIGVRRGLSQGTPTAAPPSKPWGAQQGWGQPGYSYAPTCWSGFPAPCAR